MFCISPTTDGLTGGMYLWALYPMQTARGLNKWQVAMAARAQFAAHCTYTESDVETEKGFKCQHPLNVGDAYDREVDYYCSTVVVGQAYDIVGDPVLCRGESVVFCCGSFLGGVVNQFCQEMGRCPKRSVLAQLPNCSNKDVQVQTNSVIYDLIPRKQP